MTPNLNNYRFKKGASHRFLAKRYCPHCGAGRLTIHQLFGSGGVVWLKCDLCWIAFPDTPEGRWLMMKFSGTSAVKAAKFPERGVSVGRFALPHPRNQRIIDRVVNCTTTAKPD